MWDVIREVWHLAESDLVGYLPGIIPDRLRLREGPHTSPAESDPARSETLPVMV
jgi:hypothetical protein